MSLKNFFLFLSTSLLLCGCSVKKFKNLDYKAPQIKETPAPTLNVFSNRKPADSLQPVLIFVYGGNWNSGKKEIYNRIGRNFANNGVTVVIPDYTKSPVASYDDMTVQIAQAIKWTQENIKDYSGDPNRIYLTGHSAGAHLGALAVMNKKYGIDSKTVKGIVFNDAAGLDMYTYFLENKPTEKDDYISTWTLDPVTWKEASPYYFIDENTPEIMIYNGTKTYPSILEGNEAFLKKLKDYQPNAHIKYLDKKHPAMVIQMFFPWNNMIDEIIGFMKK